MRTDLFHLLISKILIPTHRSVTYKLWKNNPTKTSTQRTDLLVFELLEIDHAKDYHLFLFWIWSRPFLPQVKVVLWREICQFKDNLADLGPKDQISYNQGQIGRINQSEYDWKFGITNMIHKSRGYWIQPIYLTGICLKNVQITCLYCKFPCWGSWGVPQEHKLDHTSKGNQDLPSDSPEWEMPTTCCTPHRRIRRCLLLNGVQGWISTIVFHAHSLPQR